jgi:hypothetical protein
MVQTQRKVVGVPLQKLLQPVEPLFEDHRHVGDSGTGFLEHFAHLADRQGALFPKHVAGEAVESALAYPRVKHEVSV